MIEVGLPGARVAFTTRVGGVSEGPYESLNLGILTDDDPALVLRNRELAAETLGLDAAAIRMGRQVHGTAVLDWCPPGARKQDGYANPGPDLPEVDGHTTTGREPLLVLVADCLPVALASEDRVTMVHCGWRGLAGGIVIEALSHFEGASVAAAVGPGIGQCCYEVGDDVLTAFADVPNAAQGRMLNLRAVAEARLREAGVEHVEHVDMCTSCHPELFFSHRRDNGVTGRQAGIAWRTP